MLGAVRRVLGSTTLLRIIAMKSSGRLALAQDRGSSGAFAWSFDRGVVALGCVLTLAMNPVVLIASEASKPAPAAAPAAATPPPAAAPAPAGASGVSGAAGASGEGAAEAVKLTHDQLDSLVAPIALYPDDLLAQTLVASTYPLEIIQLYQWLEKHKDLKDKALVDAVAKEEWDPSIQSMAAVPEVVKRLADDIQWTTDMGNAFLAQQKDVMDSVQRMRKKASDKGALKSNEQQKVETKVIEEKTVIVVESANPEVVYVPSYAPAYVYGPPVYPYPPIYYPGYAAGAAFVSFSFGVAMGAAWGGSCCGCGWGGGDVDINVNNNFNKNTNINGGNRNNVNTGNRNNVNSGNRGGAGGAGGGNKWSHNPSHRGAAPYGDKSTANKFGGQARGDAPRANQQGGRGTGASAGNRPSTGNTGAGGAGGGRGGSPSAGTKDAGGGSRGGGASAGTSNRGSSSSRGSSGGGFSGSGSRGYSGSSARSSSSRGSSSFGGSRGGGGRGGGGGGRRR